MRNNHPDALTEFVSYDEFAAYRRTIRRNGLVIVLSAPAPGGYYVTTAARRQSVTR